MGLIYRRKREYEEPRPTAGCIAWFGALVLFLFLLLRFLELFH